MRRVQRAACSRWGVRQLSTTAAVRSVTSQVQLREEWFGAAGLRGAAAHAATPFVSHGDSLSASLFRYSTGVAGVRITNGRGTVDLLPFQGQAVWRACFDGQELAMTSMFDEPRPVSQLKQWGYLDTYGAFMLHCGALAMGCPGPEDTHQLHGELPNAPFQEAWLEVGSDARGPFISLSGTYDHMTAFTHNYRATPRVKVYQEATMLSIGMQVHNRFHKAMPLMYMCHLNFKPVPDGRLCLSAPSTPDAFAVRSTFPDHVKPSQKHKDFLKALAADPTLLNHLTAEVMASLDPEVVAYVDYMADSAGWAHTMQVAPDGQSAGYVMHKPSELPQGVRWAVVDGSQQAMGMVLPATAHPEGFSEETRKGNVLSLGPGETRSFHVQAGLLTGDQVAQQEAAIRTIVEGTA